MTLDRGAAGYCPTCGQPRERDQPVERHGLKLDGYMLTFGAERVALTPTEARFIRVMIERGGATYEMVQLRVCPDACEQSMYVYACRMRRVLAKVSGGALTLHTVRSWGYELEDRRAAKVTA